MDTDHLSYKRATGVSLIGLAIQLVVGLVLLLYSLFGSDPYARPASYAILLTVPVWVLLALVFHQHKRERLEAAEAEAFAEAEGAAASVFEEAGADQVVEARRLAWMHTYLLPAASVVIGGAMVAVGAWVYSGAGELASRFYDVPGVADDGLEPPFSGLGLAIGAIGALVSFIFARYVAGMAKERVWLLLNGGAGAAVQISLLGGLIAVAHFLHRADLGSGLLEWLPGVVGVFLMVQGAEVFLNFLLNLYRPRAAGEYLRPAFDSRVLAYIAAPDRLAQSISDAINYQFGFSVSSTWFYRLLSRWVLVLALLLVAVSWLMTGLVVIKPNERGILFENGAAAEGVVEPGLVVKSPWPMDRVVSFPATAIDTLGVGTEVRVGEDEDPRQSGQWLWTRADASDEVFFVTNPVPGRAESGVVESAQSLSVLAGRVSVAYTIDDVRGYYLIAQDGPSRDRDRHRRRVLEMLAGSEVTRAFAERRVDELLRSDRSALEDELASALQSRFDAAGAGVAVEGVGLEGLSPPQTAAQAFERLTASTIRRASAVQSKRSEAEGLLAEAAGDAETARVVAGRLRELRPLERRELALRQAGDAEAETLRREIEERRRELARTLIESGGRAAQILARARADRWATSLGRRAEFLRARGQVALFEAAPTAYVVGEFLAAMKDMASGQRVFVVPPEPGVQLDQNEVGASIDIGLQETDGGGQEN